MKPIPFATQGLDPDSSLAGPNGKSFTLAQSGHKFQLCFIMLL